MGVRERSAAAGLALGAALLGLPLLDAPPAVSACASPAETAAFRGHTRLVACGAADSARPLRGPARRLFGLPLDPNRADAPTLETLPGIGPVRARAIVTERCRRAFETPDDLLRVRGIGPRTLARLSPWLAVEPSREAHCAVH
jgi:competence protein ComEA